jgi:hypothetical protein
MQQRREEITKYCRQIKDTAKPLIFTTQKVRKKIWPFQNMCPLNSAFHLKIHGYCVSVEIFVSLMFAFYTAFAKIKGFTVGRRFTESRSCDPKYIDHLKLFSSGSIRPAEDASEMFKVYINVKHCS